MTPAELVTKCRAAAGLSQGELSRQLGRARNLVCRWEAGEREPTHQDLLDVARVTGHRLILDARKLR